MITIKSKIITFVSFFVLLYFCYINIYQPFKKDKFALYLTPTKIEKLGNKKSKPLMEIKANNEENSFLGKIVYSFYKDDIEKIKRQYSEDHEIAVDDKSVVYFEYMRGQNKNITTMATIKMKDDTRLYVDGFSNEEIRRALIGKKVNDKIILNLKKKDLTEGEKNAQNKEAGEITKDIKMKEAMKNDKGTGEDDVVDEERGVVRQGVDAEVKNNLDYKNEGEEVILHILNIM